MSNRIEKLVIATAVLCCSMLSLPAEASVIYVDDDVVGGDGLSWASAYDDIQDALVDAVSGDDIWVAAGTYVPGTATNVYFVMKDGVNIYGSFAGTEDEATFDLAERDFDANPTILSGDIAAGAVNFVIFSQGNKTIDPVIDGFIISGGRWGVRTDTTNLVLRSCVITGNNDHGFQAGAGASPIIEDCIIENNSKRGLNFLTNGSPVVNGCIVRNNGEYGIYHIGTTSTITNCWIHHNDLDGIYFSSPYQTDVVRNNTIAYNAGSGVYNGEAHVYYTPAISNCIIWENQAVSQMADCEAVFSCVTGGAAGIGNFSDDPKLVYDPVGDPNNYDFHIKPDSLCIDAGNPDPNFYIDGALDIDGDDRVINEVIDIGADEIDTVSANIDGEGVVNQLDFAMVQKAWLSQKGDAEFDAACDLNYTGTIDIADIIIMAGQWLN